MAKSHGKLTVVTVATKDISPYCKTSTFTRTAKTSDVTGYGVDDEVHQGSLRTGMFTISGTYDNTVSVGPRLVFKGQEGATVAVVRKLEGTGSGKPMDVFSAVVEKYEETNPHDDYVTWSVDLKITGIVDGTAQS